uniref:Antimicrobial peptide n=1 Tax=Panagrellus redivivus TaxID=6233 RepID=A0A7E4VQI0_PANRE
MRLLLLGFATILLLSVVVAQEYDYMPADQLEHELERFFLFDWIKKGVNMIGKGIKATGGFIKNSLHAVGDVFG